MTEFYKEILALSYFREKESEYIISELIEILGYNRNQIDELKNTLINKYSKHINRELLNKYLKMLLLLEDKLVIPERSRGR